MTAKVHHSTTAPDADRAATFRRLEDVVHDSDDAFQVYRAICSAAPDLVSGCDHASVMLADGRHLVTVGASDDIALRIDEFERKTGEGPCLDVIVGEGAQVVADVNEENPWPRLSAAILEHTSVRGIAGFRVSVASARTAALNLFADLPGGFTTQSTHEGARLAAFLSVAMTAVGRRKTANELRNQLAGNREIGKAVGLVMALHSVSDREAFDLLLKAAQDQDAQVTDIARQLIERPHGGPATG